MTRVTRRFRDGHEEAWWAADLIYGPYGPDKERRAVVATTNPATLPPLTTWYLMTNLPRPGTPSADDASFAPADLAEIVRLYGLRTWVEQGYKQLKQELGWADFMVRSDPAIRRHWHLVCCAFSFCWRVWFATGPPTDDRVPPDSTGPAASHDPATAPVTGRGKMGAAPSEFPPHVPGRGRSATSAVGWIPGPSSGAAGAPGRTRPRLPSYARSSTPSARATRSTSISVANKLPVAVVC